MCIHDRISYVYKLVEHSTGKWYIGSRTKKGCHPNDNYMGSSKIVTPLIKTNPLDWEKTIIATGSIDEMLTLETKLLSESNARDNPMSYNRHNGDGKFANAGTKHTLEVRQKISMSNKGKTRKKTPEDEARRIKSVVNAIKGKPQSEEHKAKRAISMTGKSQTPEHVAKRSAALKIYYASKKSI